MADNEQDIFDVITQFSQTGADDVVSAASEINAATSGIEDVDVNIGVTVEDADISYLTELEDAQYDVTVTPAVEDSSELTTLEELDGAEIAPEINTTETEEGKAATDKVLSLTELKSGIDLVMNVTGTIIDVLQKLESFTVAPILAGDTANANFVAKTGQSLKDADLLTKIFYDDLGDTLDQVSDVAVTAATIGAPIDEATRAALTFTHTFSDQDPSAVLTTMNQLVTSGLVPNFAAAGDVLTVAFQKGADNGNDLLATLLNNATAFSDLGLTGNQALSLIKTGLDSGFTSAGDVATALTTFKKNLTTGGDDVDAFLASIGLDNPTKTGGEVGADFLTAVIQGLKDAPADGEISPDELAAKLFGKQGVKNTSAVLGLKTDSGQFDDVVGAAETAAGAIDDTLSGAIDDFVLTVNKTIQELLASDAIGLPAKIDEIKAGFQEALDVLASGGTVGDAIEVGLNIPGFNDSVNRFEASIGNFVISVLEIIASVQEFLGKDSTQTRGQINQLAGDQLAFNFKVANPDEVSGEINTAIGRGLDSKDIIEAAGTAVNELVSSGNADDIAKAQALVDSIKTLPSQDLQVAPGLSAIEEAGANNALTSGDTEFAEKAGWLIHVPVAADTTGLQAQIDAATLAANIKFGPNEGRGVAPNPLSVTPDVLGLNGGSTGGGFGGFAGNFVTASQDLLNQANDTTSNVTTAFDQMDTAIGTSTDSAVTNIDALAAATEGSDTRIATATTGNTITASFDAVRLSAETNFIAAGIAALQFGDDVERLDARATPHLSHLSKELADIQFLAQSVFALVDSALAAGSVIPGVVNQIQNNVSATQVNNNASGAEAAGSSNQFVDSIRGV